MFFKNETKSITEQQHQKLSELSSIFSDYRRLFDALIPDTLLSTLVTKLETILRSNHPQLKVGVLFETLNYEALFTARSIAEQRQLERLLRVHTTLKVSIDGGNSRMSFLRLLDAAKEAMQAGSLTRETAEDIRVIIAEQQRVFDPKPRPVQSYGGDGTTQAIRASKKDRTRNVEKPSTSADPIPAALPSYRPLILGYSSNPLGELTTRVGIAIIKEVLNEAMQEKAPEPTLSGYNLIR